MPLRERFRRAIGRPDGRSSSVSSASTATLSTRPPTGTTTPNPATETPLTATSTNNTSPSLEKTPTITLTKSSSRLTKTLTWRSSTKSKKEPKESKAIRDWQKEDAEEWLRPKVIRSGRRNQKCQDTLRAFEWKCGRKSTDGGRTKSICSGISPCASRVGSVDYGRPGLQRMSSGCGRTRSASGKLSQEIPRGDEAQASVAPKLPVGSLQEVSS